MSHTIYTFIITALLIIILVQQTSVTTYKALADCEVLLKQEAIVLAGESVVANKALIGAVK